MVMEATQNDTIKVMANMVLVPEDEYDKMNKALQDKNFWDKIDMRRERLNKGEGVHKTIEELEAME